MSFTVSDIEVTPLSEAVTSLSGEMSRFESSLGNVEEAIYEQRYREHVGSRLGRRLRRAEHVHLGQIDRLLEAHERGQITEREWDDLALLDILVKGRAGSGPEAREEYAAMEVSITIDPGDVRRAHARSGVLARAGLPVETYVAGREITPEAEHLAGELGVTVLLDRSADLNAD